jgi:hypothetical protein
MASEYKYNSLGQLRSKKLPDAGESKLWYDQLSRVVVSQNAKQQAYRRYSYVVYDSQGREVESGELYNSTAMTDAIALDPVALANWRNPAYKYERNLVKYDFISSATVNSIFENGQRNLRGRVASKEYKDADSKRNYNSYFSYDLNGNVESVLREFPSLSIHGVDNQYKKIDYEYDLTSGKILCKTVQKGKRDQFIYKYQYDADNRMNLAMTSRDGVVWDLDAKYFYYKHGSLSRMELGQEKVQGVDFAYTLQGFLKGVNSNTLGFTERDMGKDGDPRDLYISGQESLHYLFARDGFGYTLGFYEDDYKSIENLTAGGIDQRFEAALNTYPGQGLYTGNISHLVTALSDTNSVPLPVQMQLYRYDQLNRMRQMNVKRDPNLVSSNQWSVFNDNGTYATNITYDPNGNILGLSRNGDQLGGNLQMDNLTYTYNGGTNQLRRVDDMVASGVYDNDFDDHTSSTNYYYDQIGNLRYDRIAQINYIGWTAAGKLREIRRFTTSDKPWLEYHYSSDGAKVTKVQKPTKHEKTWKYTYYLRDVSGAVLATYDKFYEDPGSANACEPRLGEIDFNSYPAGSYGGGQDNGTATVQDNGCTLFTEDNAWKRILYNYNVTANTWLSFDFKADALGEVHAIGFDTDDAISPIWAFQLAGTDTWGIQDYRVYPTVGGWYHFEIPVGQFYTGNFSRLFFVGDDDVNPKDATSYYRHVKVIEKPDAINFFSYPIASYGGSQDQGNAQISLSGEEVYLDNNAWKRILYNYSITSNTVLEFDFKSTQEGDIHGIGFDTDDNPSYHYIFQVYGTEIQGVQGWHDYPGDGSYKTYRIPIGQFWTGNRSRLFFIMDDDINPKDGNSSFRNIRVYEDASLSRDYYLETLTLNENHLQGIRKLGIDYADSLIVSRKLISVRGFNYYYGYFYSKIVEGDYTPTAPNADDPQGFDRGEKKYELAGHTGNILNLISDRKIQVGSGGLVSHYLADVWDATDYYAFGMAMVGRDQSKKDRYRFGFTGFEREDDVYGKKNLYAFGDYGYDSRLGRRWTVDMQADRIPGVSPYAYALNNPVVYQDPDGNIPILPLILKAGASGAADMLVQAAFAYYFDADVESVGDAFEKVNWWQVGRSAAEGLIPCRTPGGRIGRASATAAGDVVVNALHAGSDYTQEQALQDFAVGFIGDLAGGGLGDLVSKYGSKGVARGLRKMGFDASFIYKHTGVYTGFGGIL